jgi:hypothetical protein
VDWLANCLNGSCREWDVGEVVCNMSGWTELALYSVSYLSLWTRVAITAGRHVSTWRPTHARTVQMWG